MKWPWHREEVPASEQFMAKLDEVIDDFDQVVEQHRLKLAQLREALRDR